MSQGALWPWQCSTCGGGLERRFLDSFQLPQGRDYPSLSSFLIPFASYPLISVIVLGKQCVEWWSRKYENLPGFLTVHHPSWNVSPRAQTGCLTWCYGVGSGGLVGAFSRAASCLQVSQYLLKGEEDRRMVHPLSGSQEVLYVYRFICHWRLLPGFLSVFSYFSQCSLVIE